MQTRLADVEELALSLLNAPESDLIPIGNCLLDALEEAGYEVPKERLERVFRFLASNYHDLIFPNHCALMRVQRNQSVSLGHFDVLTLVYWKWVEETYKHREVWDYQVKLS